jgi:CSLREA domain-containing protein
MLPTGKVKVLLFTTVFLTLLLNVNLSGAVLTVTTLADTDDSVCDSQCSLREAANVAAPGDTIVFARQLRGGTIQLTRTLMLQRRVTIDGPNKRRITLKGDNTFRIIETRTDGTSGLVISIDGLILRDGQAINGNGGGIYVSGGGVLNLTNVGILNNTAERGGGIFITSGGTLYLIDSTIANNVATASGGAGGIDIFRTIVRIMNSTISSNRATSTADGTGGIKLTDPQGWYIIGSTIADNSSDAADSLSAGGLAALNGIPGPLQNTILARNTGFNPDFYGRSGGSYNLIGISDRFPNGQSGNIVGSAELPVVPRLGALADNGGGLPTHALLSDSPAINAGSNALSIDRSGQPQVRDQRGYDRIINATVDMGAFEFNSSQPVAATSTITGQITGANGRGVSGAHVWLRRESGETKFALTNPFGFYRFVNVASNLTYTVECLDKRNTFSPQNVLIEEAVEYIDFQVN